MVIVPLRQSPHDFKVFVLPSFSSSTNPRCLVRQRITLGVGLLLSVSAFQVQGQRALSGVAFNTGTQQDTPAMLTTDVSRASERSSEFAATIKGKVTEKESGQPVVAAQVSVAVGTSRIGAVTDANGDYTLRGAPAGQARVSVTRLGFQPMSQLVTVPADGDVTADFALTHATLRLEDVVTTATGEQSRRTIGNAVATVKADSITKTQPVTNVTEMLQARATGVQVVQTQGVLGSSPNIRIRGVSSLSLSNEPLVVVDGARFSNENEPGNLSGVRINRLSTLDPEEIESIDVIKGPSASALYGTAASNGVVVITTKKGRAGNTNWSVFGESGLTQMPDGLSGELLELRPQHQPDHRLADRGCRGRSAPALHDHRGRAEPVHHRQRDGLQSVDQPEVGSVQHRPDRTRSASRRTAATTSFASLSARIARRRPARIRCRPSKSTASRRCAAPLRRTRKFTRTSCSRRRFAATSRSRLLRARRWTSQSGYSDRDLWTPFDGTFFAGLSNQLFSAPGYLTPTNGTAREFVGDIFGVQQRTTLERFNGTATLNWTPITWLQLTAQGGLDNGNANNSESQLPGQGTLNGSAWGPTASQGYSGIDINRTNSLQYTATLRGQATRNLTSALTSQTTLGGQYFKSGIYTLFGEGYGLGIGATTPSAAQQRLATTTTTENATAGAFVQEQLNYKDKLYGTVSARVDENSAFGKQPEQHRLSVGERLVRDVGGVVVPEDHVQRSLPRARVVRSGRPSAGHHRGDHLPQRAHVSERGR